MQDQVCGQALTPVADHQGFFLPQGEPGHRQTLAAADGHGVGADFVNPLLPSGRLHGQAVEIGPIGWFLRGRPGIGYACLARRQR